MTFKLRHSVCLGVLNVQKPDTECHEYKNCTELLTRKPMKQQAAKDTANKCTTFASCHRSL